MAATEDVNVEELKRRARRRLVGAIVLALAVAVFVPMLLESDPKPLGEDVSVKIPPVDEGKFVNRLNEKAKAEPAKAEPAKAAIAKGEMRAEAPKAEAPKQEAPPPAAATEAPKAEPEKAEPPPTEAPKVEAPKAESPAQVAKAPATSEPPAGGYSVQLAAFSDHYGANALSNKLKAAGYPAYTEPLATSKGTLYRVRVGPFPTRDAANASRDKLKGEGYSGIVAAAKQP